MKALYLALAFSWYESAIAQPIEVVTEESSYTYMENGKVSGPATEVVEETLRRAGIDDYSLTLYPWARAISIAAHKPNVLIYPIVRTPERESLFEWVGQLSTVAVFLYKFKDRTDIKIADLEEAKAYTIGVIRGDSRELYFHAHGFEKLILAADNNENFRLFSHRLVQLIPMPERDAKALCHAHHISFDELTVAYKLTGAETRIYMAYSKGSSKELVSRTVQAFQSLIKTEVLNKMKD